MQPDLRLTMPGATARRPMPKRLRTSTGALTTALLNSPDVQGYCYTQLTDVGTETNGLLTQAREAKIPLETIRRINRG